MTKQISRLKKTNASKENLRFIHQSLNAGSAQVQILLAACRRFAIVRISDNGPGWK